MRARNAHVVFNPINNFQELQFSQTLIFFSEVWHVKIIAVSTKVCPQFSKRNLVLMSFVFYCFFQKYAMTSVHKNPEIYVNIHYFPNGEHTFLPYQINLLGWKFIFPRKNYSPANVQLPLKSCTFAAIIVQ